MNSKLVALLLAVGAAAGGACSSSAVDAPLPPGPTVVDVEMDDYSFRYPTPVPAGRVVFRVRNVGEILHRITLVPLSEDVPPIDQQLRGEERRAIAPFAGMPVQGSGETASFAVDLEHGVRYAMICFVVDDGGSHAVQGMSSEFRAGGPDAQPPPTTPEEVVPPEGEAPPEADPTAETTE